MSRDAMIDPLDREIARALAVHPSPAFVARVRQQIASESEPHVWPWWWLAVGGAALGAAIVATLVMPRTVQRPLAPLSARARAGIVYLPDVTSGFSRADRRPGLSGPAAGPERPGLHSSVVQQPEVLVDVREATAMRRVLDGLNAGRMYVTPFGAAVDPIVIAPIDLQGVQQ